MIMPIAFRSLFTRLLLMGKYELKTSEIFSNVFIEPEHAIWEVMLPPTSSLVLY